MKHTKALTSNRREQPFFRAPCEKRSRSLRLYTPLSILLLLFLWEIAALIVHKELLIPSPSVVLRRLLTLAATDFFWRAIGMTMLRILAGYIIGVLTGILLAVVCYRIRPLRHLFSPLLTVIRATPVASFIILALIWFGSSRVPVFTAFLMVLPVIWSSVLSGLEHADLQLLETAFVFHMSPVKTIRLIYIPALIPQLKAGCLTAIGLAWKAGVAAEVLCVPKNAIGKYLYESKLYLETADTFAWTAAIILLSLMLENLLSFLLSGRLSASQEKKGETRHV